MDQLVGLSVTPWSSQLVLGNEKEVGLGWEVLRQGKIGEREESLGILNRYVL